MKPGAAKRRVMALYWQGVRRLEDQIHWGWSKWARTGRAEDIPP